MTKPERIGFEPRESAMRSPIKESLLIAALLVGLGATGHAQAPTPAATPMASPAASPMASPAPAPK